MLTVLIGFIAFVVLYCTAANGEWLSFGIGAAILLFLILCSHAERQETKAYMNFRDYWAKGGPDRDKP